MAYQFTREITMSSFIRMLMTSFLWGFPIYGQTLDYTTTKSDESRIKSPTDANSTYHDPCEGICDQTQPLGVFIGTFIGGAIVGALVAIVVLRCFYKNSSNPAPASKDRDDQHQVRFDVNRNDDHLVSHEDEIIVVEDPAIKGHKKLERLIKPPVSAKPAIFGGVATAATPLIHSTDSSSLDDTTITSPKTSSTPAFTSGSPSNSQSKTPKPSIPLKPVPSPKDRKDPSERLAVKSDEDSSHTYEIPDGLVEYTNFGQNSPLTQPYDTLQIIAEEVEYINRPTHIYEAFKENSHA